MVFLYDNYIDNAILTPSSELEGRPVDNLKNPHLSRNFAFDANTGNIIIQFSEPKLVTDFIVAGTNITSGNTQLLLEGANNSLFNGGYSENLELYSNETIGKKDINRTYQYWRISIADTTTTDILLGYMYIGNRLQLPGISPGIDLNYHTNTSVTFSVSQQSYANTGIDYFSSAFEFPIITDHPMDIDGVGIATREDILEFWYYNKGAKPIIMIIWDNSRNRFPPILGLVTQNTLKFKMDKTQGYYSMKFSFVESR